MQSASCHSRLYKDISELLTTDFECSSASVIVHQTTDSISEPGSFTFEITVKEGPYRNAVFTFGLSIPPSYPFKPVEIWALHPIWHPNIEPQTGKVGTPIEWSPVITLTSLIRSVQMLMLEPSNENPLNIESCSFYMENQPLFESQVQNYIRGGMFNGVQYINVSIPSYEDDFYDEDYYDDEFYDDDDDALAMIKSSTNFHSFQDSNGNDNQKNSKKRPAHDEMNHHGSIIAYGVNKRMRREEVINNAWNRLSLEDDSSINPNQDLGSSSLMKNQRQRNCFDQGSNNGTNFINNNNSSSNINFHQGNYSFSYN